MLTNDDLQAIGTLIDQKLDEKLSPLKKDNKRMHKDIIFIKKTLNIMIGHFDSVDRERVEVLENYTGIVKKN